MATVTRAQALCAAQDAMNKLLQAAGIMCGPDGKPLDQEALDKQKDNLKRLLDAAAESVRTANASTTAVTVADATRAAKAYISAPGNDITFVQRLNALLEKFNKRLRATELYNVADKAVIEAANANTNGTLTQAQVDAAVSALDAARTASVGLSDSYTDPIEILDATLAGIPRTITPAAAPIDKDTAAKKAIAEAELTRLGDAAARALTTFRGTKENPDIPRDAAVAWVAAAKRNELLLGDSKVGTAEGFLEQVEREILKTSALQAEQEYLSLKPYDDNNVKHRKILQDLGSLAVQWKEAAKKKSILNDIGPAADLQDRVEQYIKKENKAAVNAAAKEAAAAAASAAAKEAAAANAAAKEAAAANAAAKEAAAANAAAKEAAAANAAAKEAAAASAAATASAAAKEAAAAANVQAATEAFGQINAIKSTVPQIEEAYNAYNRLTPEQKKQFTTKYKNLTFLFPNTVDGLTERINRLSTGDPIGINVLSKMKIVLESLIDSVQNKLRLDDPDRAKLDEIRTTLQRIQPKKQSGGVRRTRSNKKKAKRTTRRS